MGHHIQGIFHSALCFHLNVPLKYAPGRHGLGLQCSFQQTAPSCVFLLSPQPCQAKLSECSLLLSPSSYTLGLNWEKVLVHSDICVGQMALLHPGQPADDLVAAHLSWQVVMNGRNEKAMEESSPWKSHSQWHV